MKKASKMNGKKRIESVYEKPGSDDLHCPKYKG